MGFASKMACLFLDTISIKGIVINIDKVDNIQMASILKMQPHRFIAQARWHGRYLSYLASVAISFDANLKSRILCGMRNVIQPFDI